MITLPDAQFEILVDGTPRSYRDRNDVAIASAEFLKQRNPQSEVKVKDLQSGEVIVGHLEQWSILPRDGA